MPETRRGRVRHLDKCDCKLGKKHNISREHLAGLQTISKKMKTSGRRTRLCVTVQLSVLWTTESDGAATVYRFGVGKMNAALRAFDHGFSYVVRTCIRSRPG